MPIKQTFNDIESKTGKDNIKALSDSFNHATSKMLQDAMSDILNGKLKIQDTTDLEKVFRVFKEVNMISDNMQVDDGANVSPELRSKQDRIIENSVDLTKVKKESSNGDIQESNIIKLDKLKNINKQATSAMMIGLEKQANDNNAKEL